MSLEKISALAIEFSKKADCAFGRGGSISFKDGKTMYINSALQNLSDVKENGFVALNIEKINCEDSFRAILDARESVMSDYPNPDAAFHIAMPYKFTLRLQSPAINAVACSKNASKAVTELFGNSVIFADEIKNVTEKTNTVILKNNGIVISADTTEEIEKIYSEITKKIDGKISKPDMSETDFDKEKAIAIAPALRMLTYSIVSFLSNKEISKYVKNEKSFMDLCKPYTVYGADKICAEPLFISAQSDMDKLYESIEASIKKYTAKNGFAPCVIGFEGIGIFAAANSIKKAFEIKSVISDYAEIIAGAEAFGGAEVISTKTAGLCEYMKNAFAGKEKRANEKIVIVTGSAQGFGQGIAENLIKEGANCVIADLNFDLAKQNANNMCLQYGEGKAFAVSVNVSDEESVKSMMDETVLMYGGIDTFVNNAGIVRAGGLDEMNVGAFDLVTKVNYYAYFICAKYASAVMKIQNRFNPEYFMDIIQVNSKSGLTGSNKNFAYAGSKFGGIGLTQSFALELCAFNIKVNSVCPGNFLDGPLWCDPEKGLFKQYLEAGKVPGAKTVADVKRAYEAKVPMNRGCRPEDVMNAIFYCMEQKYETGQAIPVTGGQNMLHA